MRDQNVVGAMRAMGVLSVIITTRPSNKLDTATSGRSVVCNWGKGE